MLQSFIEKNPDDPFPRYTLALECVNNLADYDRAGTLFAGLVADKPEYIATYLMYGNLLTQHVGQVEKARGIFTQGIEAARRAGDGHAASELKAALAELPESA